MYTVDLPMLLGVQQTAEIVSGKDYMYPHRSTYQELVMFADCGVGKNPDDRINQMFHDFLHSNWVCVLLMYSILYIYDFDISSVSVQKPMHSSVNFTSY